MTIDLKMIRDLEPGDEAVCFFVLRKKEMKTKYGSNEVYVSLEFGDASGRVRGSVWQDVQSVYKGLEVGDIVKVQFKVAEFSGRLHLQVDKIRKSEDGDNIDVSKLVPVVKKDRQKLLAHLDELIELVGNSFLKGLLHRVFDDETIRKSFYDAPAGKLWHHAYLGGLLEHTLSVTDISDRIGQMYPNVNRDLLLAGGLLHDIGKITSYSYKSLIDYTDEGRLIGHIVQGAQLVEDRIKSIEDFPDELRMQLLHLILSHQGKLEQASPVVPMTLEALILYYADEFDSKANAFLRIRDQQKEPGAKWSSYVKLIDRYLYFGGPEES